MYANKLTLMRTLYLIPESPFYLEGAGGEFGNRIHQDVSVYLKVQGVGAMYGVFSCFSVKLSCLEIVSRSPMKVSRGRT